MTQFTKYSRYGNGYVTNTRARKVLAARSKLVLDAQLGLESLPALKRMAGRKVPLVIESKHRSGQFQKDTVSSDPTGNRKGLPHEPSPAEDPTKPAAATAPWTAGEDSYTQSVAVPVSAAASKVASVTTMPTEEEHSGNVTLYLPKDLNQWLRDFHDSSLLSYPDIVLNAISWAASKEQFSGIFAPENSTLPVNDIFGRAPMLPKKPDSSGPHSTRPMRFRKEHMRRIMSLARPWTGDNRNAFFIGVLTAYKDHQIRSLVTPSD